MRHRRKLGPAFHDSPALSVLLQVAHLPGTSLVYRFGTLWDTGMKRFEGAKLLFFTPVKDKSLLLNSDVSGFPILWTHFAIVWIVDTFVYVIQFV